MPSVQGILNRSKYYGSFLSFDLLNLYLNLPRKTAQTSMEHLRAAVSWISKAQDSSNDGGVARSYCLIYNPFFGKSGWIHSYPETTGYIIPSFFEYASLAKDKSVFRRALRMADWECDVQMKSGAVMGGTIDETPSPAIFNTGQVIFGWVSAFKETGRKKYMESAIMAGDYLLKEQDRDGAWRKNLSKFASSRMETYVYNTRTAWGLLELSDASGQERFREGAVKNIEFALTQQKDNGWFSNNCLYKPAEPLLHTIAYAIRGVLESGLMLKETRYVQAATKAADALITKIRPDGSLAGRFDEFWEPTVEWSCLTGDAQMGIIWGRLYQTTGDKKYLDAHRKVNGFLKKVQIMDTGNPDLHGGIAGSFPINGKYGRYEILNWAVKFFMDSLMIEESIDRSGH